jgi:hypothetical protein
MNSNQCVKVKYQSESTANHAANLFSRRRSYKTIMKSYRCSRCKCWHLFTAIQIADREIAPEIKIGGQYRLARAGQIVLVLSKTFRHGHFKVRAVDGVRKIVVGMNELHEVN